MHMSDALLSPSVAFAMCAASGAAIAWSVAKIKKEELSEKKLPIMAVAGAFVFAAQMINFTIPATGSSGHIGGGILLAALLGGAPALLSISAVLVIQCLFFADGGLLALGSNIFNMGVIPCLFVYPLLFKPLMKRGVSSGRLTLASVASVVVALQLGAFAVVLETLTSGITALPFSSFVLLMQPIHLAIGLVEGLVTGADIPAGVSMKKVLAALAALTLVTGAVLSGFASSYPDGLEWSVMGVTGSDELEASGPAFESAAGIQEKTAFMPDYDYAAPSETAPISGTAAAGIIGSLMTFAAAALIGTAISKSKKHKDAAAKA